MFGEPVGRQGADPLLDEDTLDDAAAESHRWHLLDHTGRLEAEAAFVEPVLASTKPRLRSGGIRSAELRDPAFLPARRRARPRPPARIRTRPQRSPVAGLTWLVVLGLLAAFFGWFSAEPLWLSLGHGVPGTATVVDCSIHGINGRCADFTPASGALPATRVTLLGLGRVAAGQHVAARMVSSGGWAAYGGDRSTLYLRWVPGLVVVLLCGLGIAWGTGAYRLPGRRRLIAVLFSVVGPLLLTAGLFVAAW
jgi:hypothetical protein